MAVARQPSALSVFDVLEQLPRDVLRTSVWRHLQCYSRYDFKDPSNTTGRPFRLGCRRGQKLADQLTRRMHITCADDDLEAQCAFLSRLEGLEQLDLTVEGAAGDGENLILRTLLLGAAACRRLHTLQISAGCPLTAASGHAVQLCCPSLCELQLNLASLEQQEFFQPLQACGGLSKVSIAGLCGEDDLVLNCRSAVLALAHMVGLRTVSLVGYLRSTDVAPLSLLTGLRSLDLGHVSVQAATPADYAHAGRVLGSLTQLTSLCTPNWDFPRRGPAGNPLNGVLAELGNLRSLASVQLHSAGTVQADGLHALCQLTALTYLWTIALPEHLASTSGHLPRLQQLCICGPQTGAVLAASLHPFLPLAALCEMTCLLRLGASTAAVEADDGGQEAAGAFRFASMLAAAPLLRMMKLSIGSRVANHAPLSAAQAAVGTAALLPLQGRLTHLSLSDLPAGALESMWHVLCGAVRLETLIIYRCQVPDHGLLLMVGQHLQELRLLIMTSCPGITSATAVALAVARAEPLHLAWRPLLDDAQLHAFRAVARRGVTINT